MKIFLDSMNILFIIAIAIAVFTVPIAHGQTMTQQQREALINYCYQHADRPNPIDDLIDKGFLPSSFKGETCLSVKQAYDEEQIRINNELKIKEQQEALLAQQQDNAFILYNECLQNKTTTYEDCYNFLKGNKTN